MKKITLVITVLALLVLPALGQDKGEDRVAKAGTVIKEIMDIPDDIPQDVIDRVDLRRRFTFRPEICLRTWRAAMAAV